MEYTLASCSGCIATFGRRASGYVVEALDGNVSLDLPGLIECDKIPNARDEIPTPEDALHHPRLQHTPCRR